MSSDEIVLRIGRGASKWIAGNLELFRMPFPDNDGRLIRSIKPIGELAIMAGIAIDSNSFCILNEDEAQSLIEFCWRETRSGLLLAGLINRHPSCLLFSPLYEVFVRNGFRSSEVDTAIQSALDVPGHCTLEFPAWQTLEVAASLAEMGFNTHWNADELFSQTWLGVTPAGWSIWSGAAYSVTHTVFSMTHFGLYPDRIPMRHRTYLATWLPTWQEQARSELQLDLLAELFMAGSCCDIDCNSSRFALAIQDHQDISGFVEPPERSGISLTVGETDPSRVQFLSSYHTTLVVLMACLMCLRKNASRDTRQRSN